jgi:hypothetical protein
MNRLHSSAAVGLASVALVASLAAAGYRSEAPAQELTPSFIQKGRCYRIAFTIDSAPGYKILEIGAGGWLRAEVDAGSGQAQRQSFWVNPAQIVTIREQRCSE